MIRPILTVPCWALAVDAMATSAAAPAKPAIDVRMKSSRSLTAWQPFVRNGSRGGISGQFDLRRGKPAHSGQPWDQWAEAALLSRVLINPVLQAWLAECPLRSGSD